jgi:hypothetical protein
MQDESNRKVLRHDSSLLREFDENESPDHLVLYFHIKDGSFDCFNAVEYHKQMLQYYSLGIRVKIVIPRKMNGHSYFLVCLQNDRNELNSLCQVAFQCQRQYVGVSLLIKKRCFVCNAPTIMMCTGCHCAAFCSRDCQTKGWSAHKKLCKLIKASNIVIEEECLEIEI